MMNDNTPSRIEDVWNSGEAYGVFMGRWSRLVAVEFLQWLAVPTGCKWLDVGCGTGVLTRAILDIANPALVKGIDQAPGFISFAQNNIRDPRADFEVCPAESLGANPNTYDAVVSGLVLNFVPRSDQAVSAMKGATKPGGVVAAYVWDYADKMEFLRHFWNAAVSLDAEAAKHDEGKRFPLCSPERLRELFATQGFREVDVRMIDVTTRFADFADYWAPFLSGQGPAPGYVSSLSAGRQSDLRERLRADLPVSADGTIDLIARAWAVRGYV